MKNFMNRYLEKIFFLYLFPPISFNKQLSIEKLEKDLEDLIYIIRKFNLNFDELTSFLKIDFNSYIRLQYKENENLKIIKALKYLCRNSENSSKFLNSQDILNSIKTSKNVAVKNELVWLLGYSIENSNNVNLELINMIIINCAEINDDAKAFLLNKLEVAKIFMKNPKLVDSDKKTTFINKTKKNQLVVTKTIQIVKSSVKNRKSEESDFKVMNLANAIKNRNKKAVIKATLENIETIKEKTGDDRSMWRSTWGECVNLYELAAQGQPIKSDDKDNYLPNKLFGWHVFKNDYGFTSTRMYSYFINRMIVASLLKISKKQELNNNAIDKLFTCMNTFKEFINVLFKKNDFDAVVKIFVDGTFHAFSELDKLTGPDIATNFSKKIIAKTIKIQTVKGMFGSTTKNAAHLEYDSNEIDKLIIKEIENFRFDAINALYNSALRNKQILTTARIKIIENCLNEEESNSNIDSDKFKNILFNMLDLIESNADIDYKRLFGVYFKVLKNNSSSTQNVKSAIKFINGQSRDYKRCEELFTPQIIQDLLNLLGREFDDEIKEYLLEIINNYLEHEKTEGLNEDLLKLLIENVIEKETSSSNAALLSILLTTEKTQSLPDTIRTMLIENIEKSFGNFIIVILSLIQKPIKSKTDLEKLSQKLDNDFVVVEIESKIEFEKRTESNCDCTAISFLTCKLILASITSKTEVNYQTLNKLLSAIDESNDKQTKINIAKSIELLSKYENKLFDNYVAARIQNHVNNDVYDISVYMHSAYARSLAKLAKTCKSPIEAIHLENLSSMFVYESLKLNDVDFAEEINKNVLETLQCEAKKGQFEDENLFILINSILFSNEKYLIEVLDILEEYTQSKYTIPFDTIIALENTLGVSDLFEKALFILQNVIRNGQEVTNKTLEIFSDNFYLSINSRRRLRSFKILEKARVNQDLEHDVFFKLEIQKAGYGLSSRKLDKRDKLFILNFIYNQTERGFHLPIDTMNALANEINTDQSVLKILENV